MVKISVVIPLYNKEKYIAETLQTVVDQTYRHFEVLIVDDGSTDCSIDSVEPFLEDSRFKLIKQQNSGVSAARNTGVRESRTNFIAFLDADDLWMPDYLSKMQEAIEKFPDCVMFNSAGIVRNADNSEYVRQIKKYSSKICLNDFFENPHVALHTSATVVSKDAFNKVGGFPVGMKRNQDFALFFSIAFYGKTTFVGFPLSLYNGACEGQATRTPTRQVQSHIVDRYNFVHQQYLKNRKTENKSYLVFLQYELRHSLMIMRYEKELESFTYFIENLDRDILKRFFFFEKTYFGKDILNSMARMFTLATKVLWRMRGYPRVGAD
ncbi:glycosyltransferase family 2 protein [Aliiglaciecola lipolytica]|uniref:glycosyltransferase family 2 protein n=1 Tax=Aliiglaciecola lipolytica TaxID=477689 RepID=UPI001C0A354B|nr:glycosyltransferase family 2 protein [Aliiglaciecola lipolytica]MBU2880313.1 glycosyltransferase [Aliiglaciecola lipolytica]